MKDKFQIAKRKLKTKKNLESNCLCFSDDSSTMAIAALDGDIHIVRLSDDDIQIKYSYQPLKQKSELLYEL